MHVYFALAYFSVAAPAAWAGTLSAVPQEAAAPAKSSLSVLLVGHDPEQPKIMDHDASKPRVRELYAERTEAFRALLETHFDRVGVVFGDDYDPAMSAAVDVTLFDCRPKQLPLTEAEKGATGYVAPRYLPDDFSHPALMIADNSSRLGEPLGLKLDWL